MLNFLHKVNDWIRYTKVVYRVATRERNKKPFILMYHRVLRNPADELFTVQPGLYITEQTLNCHLQYFNSNFQILSVEHLLQRYFDGKNLDNHCAISFDDGWRDNYLYAFPLLKKYGIPASFFLPTKFIGTSDWFWEEEVAFFICNYDRKTRKNLMQNLCIPQSIKKLFWRLSAEDTLGITQLIYTLKNISKTKFDDIIEQIKSVNIKNVKKNKRLMLNWDEVEEINRSGLCRFYPHSHSHEVLTNMSMEDIEKEILLSRNIIKNKLNTECNIFCYPSGRYNEKIINLLVQYGFIFAIATKRGSLSRSDKFGIKRIGLHDSASNSITLLKEKLLL